MKANPIRCENGGMHAIRGGFDVVTEMLYGLKLHHLHFW